MNCRQMEPLLQDYLDGSLLPSMRGVLEAHLRECPSCRRLSVEMQSLESDLTDLPGVEAPEGLGERITAQLPCPQAGPSLSPYLFRRGGAALAAMVLVACAFFAAGRFDLLGDGEFREVVIEFRDPAARAVAVVGDFNNWNTESHFMVPGTSPGTWRLTIRLEPGVYEYGFLIDGRGWSSDPNADGLTADGFGGENSILVIEG